jgi:TRAP-type mannitol/chloroaromatic compound transport system permease small subunit
MRRVADAIDLVNGTIGRAVAWLTLFMVIAELVVVFARYLFGLGWIQLQEAILYAHAFVFLLAAAYTLRTDGHVRVDIFYRGARPERKALVNLAGALLFLLPVTILIVWISWGYVGRSWAILERSKESSGIPAVYLLKTAIIAFGVQMALQGMSLAIHSVLALRGDPAELAALGGSASSAPATP